MAVPAHGNARTVVAVLLGLCFATAVAATPPPVTHAGQAMYHHAGCVVCHQAGAKGIPGVYPALAGRVAKIAQSEAGRRYLVDVVAFGMVGAIQVDDQTIAGLMPPHPQLSDQDIASTLSWLASLDRKPGGQPVQFAAAYVHKVRAEPIGPTAVHQLRASVPSVK